MPYNEATKTLSNMSNAMVSIDQSHKQFRLLVKTINSQLKNKGGFMLYELVEAAMNLNISTFDKAIMTKVNDKDYSRSAKDISILVHLFSKKAVQQQAGSASRNKFYDLLNSLVTEFKFMKVSDL